MSYCEVKHPLAGFGLVVQASLMTCVMQVVVDSDATAKALLSNGQLRNRVTIIPLNKVSLQSYSHVSNAN